MSKSKCSGCDLTYSSDIIQCSECKKYYCFRCENKDNSYNIWICYLCNELQANIFKKYKYLSIICKDEIFILLLCLNRLKKKYKYFIPPKFIRYKIIEYIISNYDRDIPHYIKIFNITSGCAYLYQYRISHKNDKLYKIVGGILRNYILRIDYYSTYIFIGIIESSDNPSIRKLNQEEELLIKKMNFRYDINYMEN